MFVIFSLSNAVARLIRFAFCETTAEREEAEPKDGVLVSVLRKFTVLEGVERDVVETRFVCSTGNLMVAVSRGFTFCEEVVVRETIRCCGLVDVRVFLDAF